MNICIISLLFYISSVYSRDFYVGMFKKNDFLVASDRLYKPKVPFRMTTTQYGRLFHCPITYFRVVDRLGIGYGPQVQILKGGLRKKYVVLRISTRDLPISVNIYVGCENKMKPTPKTTLPAETTETNTNSTDVESGTDTDTQTSVGDGATNPDGGVTGGGDETTAGGAPEGGDEPAPEGE